MAHMPDFFDSDWVKFFEVSHDGIIIADGEGRIVYMNPASERLEEVSKEHVLGRYAGDLEAEGIYEVSVTVMVLRDRKPVTVMQYLGGKRLVITGIPIFEKDRIKWVYINERDVTELMEVKEDSARANKRAERYRRRLESITRNGGPEGEIIAASPAMLKVMNLMMRVALADVTVLLEGESGVGKGMLAGVLHANSDRKERPFVKIDCGALPETLLESELFGYVGGAFTGANAGGKRGLVESAEGGTLFLDEIGELPPPLQVKLLRLLQDRVFIPVGGVAEKTVDIRVIAATNRELRQMVAEGVFRKDLFYRLNVLPVRIPPLRERPDDVFPFIRHYLERYNTKYGYRKQVSHAAVNALCRYPWPGNVRELSNVMERLVVVTPRGVIEEADVEAVVNPGKALLPPAPPRQRGDAAADYREAMDGFERDYLSSLMGEGPTIAEAAKKLRLSESTVKRKLRKYGLRSRDETRRDDLDY